MVLDHPHMAVAQPHRAGVPVGAGHLVPALRVVAALPGVGLGGRVVHAAHDPHLGLIPVWVTEPKRSLCAPPVIRPRDVPGSVVENVPAEPVRVLNPSHGTPICRIRRGAGSAPLPACKSRTAHGTWSTSRTAARRGARHAGSSRFPC